jgi:hypothetical protein
MTTRFRNLDFDPTRPLDAWPQEAIETLIDRGMLPDWRALAAAIRRNPWGSAARTAERVTSYGEHYGVDALITDVIHRARTQIDLQTRAHYAQEIRAWRASTGRLRHIASLHSAHEDEQSR